jgi:hypothetical protein
MTTEPDKQARTVDSFEDYTIYSLNQSIPALLQMMERAKQISIAWPDVAALTAAASLCHEVAVLAAFQNSLAETLGPIEPPCGENWTGVREELKGVMQTFEKALDFHEPDIARQLFAIELPNALNHFVAIIPEMTAHIKTTYLPVNADTQTD